MEPPYTWRVEAHLDYIHVFLAGALTLEGADGLVRELGEVARVHVLRRVLFDNRATEPVPDEVDATMWRFLDDPSRFSAIAIWLNSKMRAGRVNLAAKGRAVPVRGFDDDGEALAWLRAQP